MSVLLVYRVMRNLFVNVHCTLAVRNNQAGDRDLRRTAIGLGQWDRY